MARILVIEDEPKVAQFIKRGLTAEGFQTDTAETPSAALRLAQTQAYDVITVDILLPQMSGFDVIESLREIQPNAGVLILSALDQLDDKLKGFRVGADDYLPKPFAFEELVARIGALLRRREPTTSIQTNLKYADLEINPVTRSVHRGPRVIELTNTEFRLLEYLMRHADSPCTRSQLAADVWNEHFDRETNIVDVYMMYLRKKVDGPSESPLIQTVRGVGYVLRSNEG
jgi:two-component system, OmpR family, response regulator